VLAAGDTESRGDGAHERRLLLLLGRRRLQLHLHRRHAARAKRLQQCLEGRELELPLREATEGGSGATDGAAPRHDRRREACRGLGLVPPELGVAQVDPPPRGERLNQRLHPDRGEVEFVQRGASVWQRVHAWWQRRQQRPQQQQPLKLDVLCGGVPSRHHAERVV